MKYFFLLTVFIANSILVHATSFPLQDSGLIKITFIHTVKGKPLELHTGKYTNPFAEDYSISKFKYYISHLALDFTGGKFNQPETCFLIDESNKASLSIQVAAPVNTYQSISFMLGVDSSSNVSGAQTGALDPLNDMFWTWNTGYVMAKLEGHSPQSNLVNHKIEFHIGGFAGAYQVLKNISLRFPTNNGLNIQKNKTSEIFIEADLDSWWQQPHDIKITEHAVCATPGPLAKQIADNYSNMFSIKSIINNQD